MRHPWTLKHIYLLFEKGNIRRRGFCSTSFIAAQQMEIRSLYTRNGLKLKVLLWIVCSLYPNEDRELEKTAYIFTTVAFCCYDGSIFGILCFRKYFWNFDYINACYDWAARCLVWGFNKMRQVFSRYNTGFDWLPLGLQIFLSLRGCICRSFFFWIWLLDDLN